jgi:hypothetical protein
MQHSEDDEQPRVSMIMKDVGDSEASSDEGTPVRASARWASTYFPDQRCGYSAPCSACVKSLVHSGGRGGHCTGVPVQFTLDERLSGFEPVACGTPADGLHAVCVCLQTVNPSARRTAPPRSPPPPLSPPSPPAFSHSSPAMPASLQESQSMQEYAQLEEKPSSPLSIPKSGSSSSVHKSASKDSGLGEVRAAVATRPPSGEPCSLRGCECDVIYDAVRRGDCTAAANDNKQRHAIIHHPYEVLPPCRLSSAALSEPGTGGMAVRAGKEDEEGEEGEEREEGEE